MPLNSIAQVGVGCTVRLLRHVRSNPYLHITTVIVSLMIVAVWLSDSSRHRTYAQQSSSAKIVSPVAGSPLFGLVTITGTAANPDFQRYSLEFDLQDTDQEQWFPIAGSIAQQVADGLLGQWDTTAIPDGRYQIRLRVVLRNGTVLQDVVQNLRVINREPTALPTVVPSETPILATIPPTVGPSPSPIIQQPPTSTPRPAIPTVVATLTGGGTDSAVSISDRVSAGLVTGTCFTAFIVGIIVSYSLLHKRFRVMVHRLINNVRDDVRG
jgi:hypothetical protein